MSEVPLIPIDPHTMAHTDDPETSKAAARKAKHEKRTQAIVKKVRELGGYRSQGGEGCISDDLQEAFGISDQRDGAIAYSGITGYYAKLERLCWIERTGATRLGHRFQRQQEIIWALTDEEREAKLLKLERNLNHVPNLLMLDKIAKWFELDQQLQQIQLKEEELREEIMETFIPDAPIGKYVVSLGPANGKPYELLMEVLKRSTRMRVRERK